MLLISKIWMEFQTGKFAGLIKQVDEGKKLSFVNCVTFRALTLQFRCRCSKNYKQQISQFE